MSKALSLVVVSVLFVIQCGAQTTDNKLNNVIRLFHAALVEKNTVTINQLTDKALSYGHSNGWVETKSAFLKNIETGYMRYLNYKEDSVGITTNSDLENARFKATVGYCSRGSRLKMNGSNEDYSNMSLQFQGV